MGCGQQEDERHHSQQCRKAEGCYKSNLCFFKTPGEPQADHRHVALMQKLLLKKLQLSIELKYCTVHGHRFEYVNISVKYLSYNDLISN